LDQKPVAQWSAGAGLKWVLKRDEDSLPYLFPTGIPNAVNFDTDLPNRNIPIALPLPNWNQWLPHTHPKDAWNAGEFDASDMPKVYQNIRNHLTGPTKDTYMNSKSLFYDNGTWDAARLAFLNPKILPLNQQPWSPAYSRKIYDTALWQLVKTWGLMQEFSLEAKGPILFGTLGQQRGWFQSILFNVAPFMLHISPGSNGIEGSAKVTNYLSLSWWEVQTQVYGHRYNPDNSPIDYPYIMGLFKNLYLNTGFTEPIRFVKFLLQVGQTTTNGYGPDNYHLGWSPGRAFDVSTLVTSPWTGLWTNLPSSTRVALDEALLRAWLNRSKQYTVQQYVTGGMVNPAEIPTGFEMGTLGDHIWVMVPKFRSLGVNETLLQEIVDWAKTLYPKAAWDTIRSGNVAPTVVMSSPLNVSQYPAGQPINVMLDFRDFRSEMAPATAAFYVDDTKIGELPYISGSHLVFPWTNPQPGQHMVSAIITIPTGQIQVTPSLVTITGTASGLPDPVGAGGSDTTEPIAHVSPVVWKPGSGNISFHDLAEDSRVSIYDRSGRTVRDLDAYTGQVAWDVKNDQGDPITSGVYLYRVTGTKPLRGKIVVVR
jgi:hypothetical protein